MCLKTALCPGSFPAQKPHGQVCPFKENLRNIGKIIEQFDSKSKCQRTIFRKIIKQNYLLFLGMAGAMVNIALKISF